MALMWFDDSLPAGAQPTGVWNWDTTQKASGTQSHTEPRVSGSGFTQHYFAIATQTITPGVGDALFTYVLIDPCNPPQEIMLQWSDGPSWEHRAYWGANVIDGGTDGTNSRRRMGDLPVAGQWVRLEAPASQVGMETITISGMAFSLSDGHAWWDRAGKKPAGTGMLDRKAPAAMVASLDGPAIEAAPPQILLGRVMSWLQRPMRRRSLMRLDVLPTMSFAEPHATTVGSEKSRYSLYSPELNLMAETALTSTAGPTIEREYIWFGGQPLAQVETTTGATSYYFNDHLGTPILQTNSAAAITWRVEREPYGTIFAHRAGFTLNQPLSFPGQESDPLTPERTYNIFRWYRAGWGRYTQGDLVGVMPGGSLYSYGYDDPLWNADALGLLTFTRAFGPGAPKPTSDPSTMCKGAPTKVACTNLRGVRVDCACNCSGSGFSPEVVMFVNIEMYINRSTHPGMAADRSIVDFASAVAHEYKKHLNPAADAVERWLRSGWIKDGATRSECEATCATIKATAPGIFHGKLDETRRTSD